MLILRDLLAGPARYADLERGLPGMASNLLTSRLRDLEEQGLIERTSGPYGTPLYQVTELGEKTRPALEELGKLGFVLGPAAPPAGQPANLRFMALGAILRAGLPVRSLFEIAFHIEEEWLHLVAMKESLNVSYGAPPAGTSEVGLSYESLMKLLEPGADLSRFRSEVEMGDESVRAFDQLLDLIEAALAQPVG